MKKYEGLFILEVTGKEDAEKETVERIQKTIEQAGGRVETVQRMGPRPFARISRKRTSGNYVNYIFHAPPKAIHELDAKFHLEADIIRWLFSEPIPEMPAREPRPETAGAAAGTGAGATGSRDY